MCPLSLGALESRRPGRASERESLQPYLVTPRTPFLLHAHCPFWGKYLGVVVGGECFAPVLGVKLYPGSDGTSEEAAPKTRVTAGMAHLPTHHLLGLDVPVGLWLPGSLCWWHASREARLDTQSVLLNTSLSPSYFFRVRRHRGN